jgi:hypothetical protein
VHQEVYEAIDDLDKLDYKGNALWIKMKWQADHLLQWLPETTTTEGRLKAIVKVKGGINMTSIFYNIGPWCLSTDEMFQALEYKDLLSKYNKDVVAHKALVGNKEVEVKAKKKPTVKDYQDLLQSMLDDDYYSRRTRGLKVVQLKELLETVKDSTILDISVWKNSQWQWTP